MGIYKELDITYQEIVDAEADRLIAGIQEPPFTPRHLRDGAEEKIWRDIAPIDYNLADALVSEMPYEAALVCIERGEIPSHNPEFQRLVVSLAYNAISNYENFVDLIEHSRFSVDDVQQMLDLAAAEVLKHQNFSIAGFEQLSPQ